MNVFENRKLYLDVIKDRERNETHIFNTILFYMFTANDKITPETEEEIKVLKENARTKYHNDPFFNLRVKNCVFDLLNIQG